MIICIGLVCCNTGNDEKHPMSENKRSGTIPENNLKGIVLSIEKYEPLGTATHFYNLILTNDSSNFLTREQEPHARNFLLPDSLLQPLIGFAKELSNDSIDYMEESTGIKICIRERASETCTISNKKNAYAYLMKIDKMYQSNPQLGTDVTWIGDIIEVYRYQYHIKE